MRVRNTRQLRAVHEVLDQTREREKGLGVATVCRTVKALMEDGNSGGARSPWRGPAA